MNEQSNLEDLMEYPCHYQFKAIGQGGDDFCREVVAAIALHASVPSEAVRSKPSSHGTYQSITVELIVYSATQLTRIYAQLKKVSGLKMLL